MKQILKFVVAFLFSGTVFAEQNGYWQQNADYVMDVTMDVKNYQYTGSQKISYTNNSPNSLKKIFYHLYPNAFQPGSEMDIRLQTIKDPDGRMVNKLGTKENPIIESKISLLKPDEIGFLKVNSLLQNGEKLTYKVQGTILEVVLKNEIKPGETTVFEMDFVGQVPLQIRRSGRNNAEGVALSMSQWYPKLAEYDFKYKQFLFEKGAKKMIGGVLQSSLYRWDKYAKHE